MGDSHHCDSAFCPDGFSHIVHLQCISTKLKVQIVEEVPEDKLRVDLFLMGISLLNRFMLELS